VSVQQNGDIHFNGKSVNKTTFLGYLQTIDGMWSQPITIFKPAPDAPCSEVEKVRQVMDRVLSCSEEANCGEGRYWGEYSLSGGSQI
jgi:hypothetical protein